MKSGKLVWVLVLVLPLLIGGCGSTNPIGEYQLEIKGAVDRSLKGSAGLTYENDQGRDEIKILHQPFNDNIQSFALVLPSDLNQGTYPISTQGPVSSGYIIFTDSATRLFTDNDRGSATFQIQDNKLSVSFELTLDDKSGSGEQVQITGRIWDLPYQNVDGSIKPPDQTAVDATSSDEITPAGTGLICFMGLLLIGNFIFQFSIGAKVYASQGSTFLRSLRGTRTFVLGWMEPKYRHTMILWSILLGALLLLLLGMFLLAQTLT
jgi:hypothetical protein